MPPFARHVVLVDAVFRQDIVLPFDAGRVVVGIEVHDRDVLPVDGDRILVFLSCRSGCRSALS